MLRSTFAFLILATSSLLAQVPDHVRSAAGDSQAVDRSICMTAQLMELRANQDQLDDKGRQILGSLTPYATRPVMQSSVGTPEGHFRIHFNTTGQHAVSRDDENGNSIPDYIDSVMYYMEYAWALEIDEYGFDPPPPDNQKPGQGGPDGRLDVYIQALPDRYYGLAYPEDPDNLISSSPKRVHGYLVLDNDYIGYPTPGIRGLRVTSAHELHHIIQFASYRYDLNQAALYESTSTWFEREVHPSILDYRYYTDSLLHAPQKFGFSTNNVGDGITGYAHMLYLVSIAEQTDIQIVKRIWEQFRTRNSFDAIDAALRGTAQELNLAQTYCTFAQWCYYTRDRAATQAFFKDAGMYPRMLPTEVRPLNGDEIMIQGSLSPLSFALYRVATGDNGLDTIDFVVTNARSDIGAGGTSLGKDNYTLDVSAFQQSGFTEFVRSSGDTIYYRMTGSHGQFCLEALEDGRPNVVLAVSTFPQPFINDGANKIVFAMDPPNETLRELRLTIYSAGSTPIVVQDIKTTTLDVFNNRFGIVWDGRNMEGNLVPSGIYLYTVKINSSDPILGKFAVVRK